MFIYYGKTFESARQGECVVGVVCEHCGRTYYYELARVGAGAHSAPYGIGTSNASKKAQVQSESDLQRRLAMEAELVPCPNCNWISSELVEGYRLSRYRGVGKLAFVCGFAGTILSLVAAWFIYIGSPLDRWLLPYMLIGAPAIFIAISVALLFVRKWLRGRIQPNREFPQEPRLPHGTPPALVLDETTQTLRPGVRSSTPVDDVLDFQLGRHTLPPLCSECLQTAKEGRGWPIRVTRLVSIAIPRCATCAGKSDSQQSRISFIVLSLGLLVGASMIALMVRASTELWIIIVSSLVLLGFSLVLIAIVAQVRTAPAKVVGRDRSRGVVRLRFRNPDYVLAAIQHSKEIILRN